MSEMTICANCKYHKISGTQGGYTCGHPNFERSLGINPVTGEECYISDGGIVQYNQYPYCRDINHGDCALYESL